MTRGSEPGYVRQPKVYRLVFDEHPGLVVRARSASIEQFLEVNELSTSKLTPEVARRMFSMLADRLVSWNLQNQDGSPVPTTPEAILKEDWDFVLMITLSWMDAVAGVSAPLAQPSSGGSVSLVESLPMEPLSQSRVS